MSIHSAISCFPETRLSMAAIRLAPVDGSNRNVVALESVESFSGQLVAAPWIESDKPGNEYRSGDLLFGKLRPYLAKVWVADRDGGYIGDFIRMSPRDGFSADFLRYAMLTPTFISAASAESTGSKMPRTEWDRLRNLTVPAPALEQQVQIVDYLDHETAEIDALILDLGVLKETTMERLISFHCGVFGSAVSPSSLPELRGALFERDERAGSAVSERGLLSVSISTGVVPRSAESDNQSASEDLSKYKLVERDDIVVNRMRAFQGAIGVSTIDGLTSPDYAVLAPLTGSRSKYSTSYLSEVMRSDRFVGEITRRLRGIGTEDSGQVRTPRISVHDLLRIPVALPSRVDQVELLATWESESHAVQVAMSDVENAITLASERRAALISAAVTGLIDVTGRRRGPSEAERLEVELSGAR